MSACRYHVGRTPCLTPVPDGAMHHDGAAHLWPRYPWLLPSDHPLYRPWLGFARIGMSRSQESAAMRRIARRFESEAREWLASL